MCLEELGGNFAPLQSYIIFSFNYMILKIIYVIDLNNMREKLYIFPCSKL